MSKGKERSEVEYLRGLVRELRSHNKHLKNELRRLQKRPIEEKEEDIPEINNNCLQCNKGMLSSVNIAGIRIITTCSMCDYRKIEKVNVIKT